MLFLTTRKSADNDHATIVSNQPSHLSQFCLLAQLIIMLLHQAHVRIFQKYSKPQEGQLRGQRRL